MNRKAVLGPRQLAWREKQPEAEGGKDPLPLTPRLTLLSGDTPTDVQHSLLLPLPA